MQLNESLPPDLVNDLARAIESAATEMEAEDWIVNNLVRFPAKPRLDIIREFIAKHFGSGHHWSSWAQLDISVAIKNGRVFHSANELVGYLHEFERKFPFGRGAESKEASDGGTTETRRR